MSTPSHPHLDIESETQRQMTALLYRNAGFALGVHLVNSALLAWVNLYLRAPRRVVFAWWGLVVSAAIGRYLLTRGFQAVRPDATAAMAWRRRFILATTLLSLAWGLGAPVFMWHGPEGAFLFTGLVLAGMVAGAVPLLSSVPTALHAFVGLVGVPMTTVVLLQARTPIHWAFGLMCLIFLGYVLSGAKYLHQTLGVSVRLGLEQARLAANLERANATAERALWERKEQEEATRRERDFAESLIATAQAIVVVLDPEGRILRLNQYMEDLSGYRLEEILGADWFSIFSPPGDRDTARTRFRTMILEARGLATTSEILAKDERRLLVEWHDKPLKGPDGATLGLLAVGQDVTQREKLAESQRLLSAAVEQSHASIVITDTDGRIQFVNAGFTRTTGYTQEEAIGQNPRFLKSGLTPMETFEEMWSTITSGRTWHGELLNRKKNGELYWETAHITPIVDADGRIAHYLAVKDDITQRKRMEEALRERKQFLSTILENEPECVKVLDADGTLLQMNRAGLAMLEVDSLEEAKAFGMEHFVAPEHRAAFEEMSHRALEGQTGKLEFQIQGNRGTRRRLETHAAPLRDASGRITHVLGVTRDVTDRWAAEERLALSLRGSGLALGDWHIPSGTLVFGEGWTKLLGYEPSELLGNTTALAGLLNLEDVPATRAALVRHLKGETPIFETEVRMRHKDGRWLWVLARAMAVERDANGRAVRVAGTAKDVTHRKEAEAEIARLSQWNELLLNSAGEGIYAVNLDGCCTYLNPAAIEMLGFSPEEVLGQPQHDLFHHHHIDGSPYLPEDCPIRQTLNDGIQRKAEDGFTRKNGEIFPARLTVTPMHESGRIMGAVAVFEDITHHREMELELKRLATTDPLTGVANRRRFLEEVDMELARHKRFGKPAALLMVDVDHFKGVNDTYGHATGDAVLQHLAGLSRLRLRRLDLFGRLGGEEFGILLPGTDGPGAQGFAELFRRHVADTPAQTEAGEISLAVSIGVTLFGPGDAAPDSILARADTALYRAKAGGRNRVEVGWPECEDQRPVLP